jgi:predicted nucleic acid-binding protein
MIIADTCVITHLFNATAQTQTAQKVLKKDPCWILPAIWQEEYANVLSKLARKERKPIEDVLGHFQYTVDRLKDSQLAVSNGKALQISIECKISVYDAHFVSLAMDYNTVLVTEDKEIIKNCPHHAVTMQGFLE